MRKRRALLISSQTTSGTGHGSFLSRLPKPQSWPEMNCKCSNFLSWPVKALFLGRWLHSWQLGYWGARYSLNQGKGLPQTTHSVTLAHRPPQGRRRRPVSPQGIGQVCTQCCLPPWSPVCPPTTHRCWLNQHLETTSLYQTPKC